MAALQAAANAAPGPLSALAAAIATFATRVMWRRRLMFALLAEPADPELDEARATFRRALAAQFGSLIARALKDRHLQDQDPALLAPALLGALIEGLAGPLAVAQNDAAQMRDHAQQLTLFALRGLGLPDARARGLVVHAVFDFP